MQIGTTESKRKNQKEGREERGNPGAEGSKYRRPDGALPGPPPRPASRLLGRSELLTLHALLRVQSMSKAHHTAQLPWDWRCYGTSMPVDLKSDR